jgi:exopolysaccharide production protein ExoZ
MDNGTSVSRNHALQALRGLAAFSVLYLHCNLWARDHGGWVDPGREFYAVGVDVFFVLSGFLMAALLDDAGSGLVAAARFLARRMARLMPAFLLVAAAEVVLARLAVGAWVDGRGEPLTPRVLVDTALMVPTCGEGGFGLLPWSCTPVVDVAWTLIYECAFYVMASVAVLLGMRRPAFLAFVLSEWIGVFAANGATGWSVPWLAFFGYPGAPHSMILLFAAGIAARCALPWAADRAGTLLPAALAGAAALGLLGHGRATMPAHGSPLWAAASVCAVLGFVLLDRVADVRRGRVGRWAAALGDWSYSLYLVHGMVLSGASRAVQAAEGWAPGERAAAVLVLTATASIALSALLHTAVERPCAAAFNRRVDGWLRWRRGG